MRSLLSGPLELAVAAGGVYFLYWAMVRQGTISRWVHRARWSRRLVKWGVVALTILALSAMALHFGPLLLKKAIQ